MLTQSAQQPILMSTGWLGRRWGLSEGSVIARHEVRSLCYLQCRDDNCFSQFKGMSKLKGGLEDWVARERAERAERSRHPAQRSSMPGAFDSEDEDMDATDED